MIPQSSIWASVQGLADAIPTPTPTLDEIITAPQQLTIPNVADSLALANLALQVSAVIIAALTLILAATAIVGARSLREVRSVNSSMQAEATQMAAVRDEIGRELTRVQNEFETLVLVAHLYNEGQNAYSDADYDRASAFYIDALELQPDNVKIRVRLARTYINQGLVFQAESLLRNISSNSPTNADAWRALATVYRYSDRSKALEAMQTSLQLDPSADESWNYLGLLLRDADKDDEAIAAHQQALRLNPGDPIAHFYSGLLQAKNGSARSAASLDQAHARVDALRRTRRIKTIWADTIDWAYFVSVADHHEAIRLAGTLARKADSARNRRAILQHMIYYLAARNELQESQYLSFFPAEDVDAVRASTESLSRES